MVDDKTRADAYSMVHAALHSLRANVITFAEFMKIIRVLRRELEQEQQQGRAAVG